MTECESIHIASNQNNQRFLWLSLRLADRFPIKSSAVNHNDNEIDYIN